MLMPAACHRRNALCWFKDAVLRVGILPESRWMQLYLCLLFLPLRLYQTCMTGRRRLAGRSFPPESWTTCKIYLTSGFWPRVCARALRPPVFLGSLPSPRRRCAPSTHRSFAAPPAPPEIKNKLFPETKCLPSGPNSDCQEHIFFQWARSRC